MNKKLLSLIFAGFMAVSTYAADVEVRIAPPAAIVETRGPAPGAEYVWVNGYHRWDGERYVWVAGRWDRPPRPHQVWVAHRWVKRSGGYVMVEGHWK